jgi:sulfoxide reductase heme-binding subunit YedZ
MAQARKPAKRVWEVWRDASGRLSALRIVTLALLFLPTAIAAWDYFTVGFGPRPVNDVIHRTGYWALLFLLVSLSVTPLRRVGRFGRLIDVRRMIGVAAFIYAAVHVVLYVVDQRYDLLKVASEIALRLYLTIGFVALIGLAVLAATSTDGMVRRLGGMRWARLHQIAYVIALLALIHFFQQTKADVWLPTFVAGLFGWLMGYRFLIWRKTERGELPSWTIAALAVTVAVLTFLAEAIGIGLAFNVSPWRVLQTAFDFDFYSIRPGWLVLAAGLIVAVLDLIRARVARGRRSTTSARPLPAWPVSKKSSA